MLKKSKRRTYSQFLMDWIKNFQKTNVCKLILLNYIENYVLKDFKKKNTSYEFECNPQIKVDCL
jgi:hypothetical protein